MSRSSLLPSAAALAALSLLAMNPPLSGQDLEVPFEKFTLDNGLQVVIHEDRSDPVVAVYVIYHVGSGREEPGRSGFAHLFEHLMFQGSAHVADDEHFKKVSEAGGTLNGTTNRDRTNYFETLPSHQLETALWLESDRMGFLLDAMTQEKLDNQREVVRNERRQNYENVPYAQSEAPIMSALYSKDHPYSWLTIGSHEDLQAASLDDVRNFFRRWYGPNNATLAIGGDVDTQEALALAKKWFGSLARGPEVGKPASRPTLLAQTRRLVCEDKVQIPELSFIWPSAPRDSEDDAALDMLAAILSANKAAILDRALTVDETLATRVSAGQDGGELAGEFNITVRAAPGVTLDTLERRVRELLVKLGNDGVDAAQLERQKTRFESSFINRLETVGARTNALAEANCYTGDPANVTASLHRTLALTPARVNDALRRYVLDRPAVIMSVVPDGKLDMAASGRSVEQHSAEASLDRASQPAPAVARDFKSPQLWHDTLANGVAVTGTRYTELPLVSVQLAVPGGHLRETIPQAGLATLTAELLNEGTEALDTIAFSDRLDELGATLRVGADDDEITLSVRTLKKHLPECVALLQDVVLHPRLAAPDFERLKAQRLAALATRGDSIRTIASNAWARLMYGRDALEGWPSAGTTETVGTLTVDDARRFWKEHGVPGGARLTVVGDLDAGAVRDLFANLTEHWRGAALPPLVQAARPASRGARVFLVDKPGAPQSEIRIGHAGVSSLDPDYYPLTVLNYVLGGAFSSRINMNLREDKGYTYGARSGFDGGLRPGLFSASAPVRTDATKESIVELVKELTAIRDGVTDKERDFASDALLQAMNRQYESIGSLQGMLTAVSQYGYPDDYLGQRQQFLRSVTREQLDELAKTYIHADGTVILVVGDGAAVREGLQSLGYGGVTELDIDGNEVVVRS